MTPQPQPAPGMGAAAPTPPHPTSVGATGCKAEPEVRVGGWGTPRSPPPMGASPAGGWSPAPASRGAMSGGLLVERLSRQPVPPPLPGTPHPSHRCHRLGSPHPAPLHPMAASPPPRPRPSPRWGRGTYPGVGGLQGAGPSAGGSREGGGARPGGDARGRAGAAAARDAPHRLLGPKHLPPARRHPGHGPPGPGGCGTAGGGAGARFHPRGMGGGVPPRPVPTPRIASSLSFPP